MWLFMLSHFTDKRGDDAVAEAKLKYTWGLHVEPYFIEPIPDAGAAVFFKPHDTLTDAQIQQLLKHPAVLPGSISLIWYEFWMRPQITEMLRAYSEARKGREEAAGRMKSMLEQLRDGIGGMRGEELFPGRGDGKAKA